MCTVSIKEERAEEAAGTASAEAVSLTKGMRKLELTSLDESAARVLANAKDRFKLIKATEAFAYEALELSDRDTSHAISSHGDNTGDNRQSRGRICSVWSVH